MTKGKPWLAKMIKDRGLGIKEYMDLVLNSNLAADEIIQMVSEIRKTGTGMYYSADELGLTDSVEHDFVRVCLRDRGMEFIENGTLYRI